MFKVVADGNPKQVEMTQDVLDMAIAISNYIQKNPMESDFFCICPSIDEQEFADTLTALKRLKEEVVRGNDVSYVFLDNDQYNTLDRILGYGRNFADDIPELESLHDSICEIEVT